MSQVTKGFAWSAIERISTQGITFLLSIIIARIVSPEAYGLIVMIQVFLSLSQVFIDGGFATALIQKHNRTEEDYHTAFIFNMAVAVFLYVVLFLCSPIIAAFYEEPQLISLTRVLGLSLIISSLSIVQTTRLTISLDFKTQSKASLIGVVIGGIVGIVLAYTGFEVWALVIQSLVSKMLTTISLYYYSRWHPSLIFSRDSFRHLLSFGSKLLISNLMMNLCIQLNNLIIGKRFSSASLAFYNRAFTLTMVPATNASTILTRIIYPLECKLQDSPSELKAAYNKYLHLANSIIVPVMFFLACMAEPLIRVMLTDKWLPCVPYFILFCVNFSLFPWQEHSGNILAVVGRTDVVLKASIIKRILSVFIIVIAVFFDVMTICIGMVVGSFLELLISIIAVKKTIGYSIRSQIRPQIDVFVVSLVIGLVAYLVMSFIENVYVQLFVGSLICFTLYLISMFFLKMPESVYIKDLLKNKG